MGKPKAPRPPDPKTTAAAQTGTNVTTALANARLGNVNRYGPDGSVTHRANGGEWLTDPSSGQRYWVPQYEQHTTLSPQQQAIKDQTDRAQLGLASLAADQTGRIGGLLSDPFNLDDVAGGDALTRDYSADRQRVEDAMYSRLEPRIAQDREALRTQLVNQGLTIGSDAYSSAMGDFGRDVNDARTAVTLAGGQEQSRLADMDMRRRAQAVQEQFAARNQPINEITALLSGSQVSMPQFGGTAPNMPTIPTVDHAGLVNQNYNQQMGLYNSQMAQHQNLLGGLFGLGSAFAGNPSISDRRKKKNIRKVGSLDGHPLYRYNYKGDLDDGREHVGVMAQDVEKKRPDAVVAAPDGTKAVKYGALFGVA